MHKDKINRIIFHLLCNTSLNFIQHFFFLTLWFQWHTNLVYNYIHFTYVWQWHCNFRWLFLFLVTCIYKKYFSLPNFIANWSNGNFQGIFGYLITFGDILIKFCDILQINLNCLIENCTFQLNFIYIYWWENKDFNVYFKIGDIWWHLVYLVKSLQLGDVYL